MATNTELIDELLKDCQKPEDIVGENGLRKQLTKTLLGAGDVAELTHHLGYEKHVRQGMAAATRGMGRVRRLEIGTIERTATQIVIENHSFQHADASFWSRSSLERGRTRHIQMLKPSGPLGPRRAGGQAPGSPIAD